MTAYQKATLAILGAGIVVLALSLNTRPTAVAAAPAADVTNAVTGGLGITTSADGMIKVKPDVAILSLGVTAESASAADAQAQVAQRVAHVLSAAKALGIEDKDVKTSGYTLSPGYQPNSYSKNSGYVASEQLSFTLRDVSKAGKALDALAGDTGATNASIQFVLDDRKPAEAEARTLAVVAARAKAEAMAKAAGVRVGQLLSITDQASGYPGPINYGAAAPGARVADTVIPVGDLDVAVSVQVQFAIA